MELPTLSWWSYRPRSDEFINPKLMELPPSNDGVTYLKVIELPTSSDGVTHPREQSYPPSIDAFTLDYQNYPLVVMELPILNW